MISTVRRVRLVSYWAHNLAKLCHSKSNRGVKLEGVPVDYGAGNDRIQSTLDTSNFKGLSKICRVISSSR